MKSEQPALPCGSERVFFWWQMEIKITDTTKSGRGWCKPSQAAKYCNTSLKVFRGWMKNHGLPHIRLPSNRILVSLDDLDRWLHSYQVTNNLVDELLEDF
jgi:excisionase family DNA binding protein